ncbi:MAG: hypothetical protein MJ088_02775 [Clostridia bacterium]|nr:hypothetical protein [Clostridia bacterium]
MPEVTTAQIKAKLVELRERLAALTAETSAMPEGSARDLASLERETAENLMTAIENRRTEGPAFATLLARMQYIYQAKAGELAPDEIETKAAAMGKNRRFVDTFARGTSNDARMGLLDTLFGGTRTEHITSWLRDIENNVTVDYAAAFETLCTEPEGEAREALRTRFLSMGVTNEGIRMEDYLKAKTPEDIYAVMTDPQLERDHEAAAAIYAEIGPKDENIETYPKTLRPSQPDPEPIPAFLARTYFYFYDYSGTEEAQRSNQKMTDRLHSDLPEDREYQKEFAREIINKMLAVPDEKLCPKNLEEAAALYREDHYLMRAMFTAESFLGTMNNDYDIPDDIRDAVLHKSGLLQQNVMRYASMFKMAASEHYGDMALVNEIDADELAHTAEHVKNDPELMMALLEYTAARKDVGSDAYLGDTHVLPDGGKYDGLRLEEPQIRPVAQTAAFADVPLQMMTAPEKPTAPGGWATFWHRFGFFQREFTAYEAAMTEYNRQLEQYNAAVEAQNVERAAHASWREANNARMRGDMNNARSFADLAKEAGPQYKAVLDEAFAGIEERSGGVINRLDYIMIGGRTLRALLMEEYVKTHPGTLAPRYADLAEKDFVNESAANGHVYDIILAAALQGRDVRYLRPDPLSGKLVPGADGKIPEYTLGEPNALVTAGTMERGQLKAEAETAVPLNFIGADDARQRITDAENCKAAVKQLNYWEVVSCNISVNPMLRNMFLSDWEKTNGVDLQKLKIVNNLTVSRTIMQNLSIAYLISQENMTPREAYDPAYRPEHKQRVGAMIASMATDPNCDCRLLAKYAVDGMARIGEIIDEKLAGLDLADDKTLMSPELQEVYCLMQADFDLMQDFYKEGKTKDAAKVAIAEKYDIDISDDAAIEQAFDKLSCKADLVSNTLSAILDGRVTGARLCTGAVYDLDVGKGEMLISEMTRKILSREMKAGKPFSEVFDNESVRALKFLQTYPGSVQGGTVNQKAFIESGDVRTMDDGRKYATHVLAGGLAKECRIKIEGFDIHFAYDPTGAFKGSEYRDFVPPKMPVEPKPEVKNPPVIG